MLGNPREYHVVLNSIRCAVSVGEKLTQTTKKIYSYVFMLLALVSFKNNGAHSNHHLETWLILYNTDFLLEGVNSKAYEFLKENKGLDQNFKVLASFYFKRLLQRYF